MQMWEEFLSELKEQVKQKRNLDQNVRDQKNIGGREDNFLYICSMAKSKIISVPMSNHQKLVELSYLIKDRKAKRMFYCLDEFYFEVFDDTPSTKKK